MITKTIVVCLGIFFIFSLFETLKNDSGFNPKKWTKATYKLIFFWVVLFGLYVLCAVHFWKYFNSLNQLIARLLFLMALGLSNNKYIWFAIMAFVAVLLLAFAYRLAIVMAQRKKQKEQYKINKSKADKIIEERKNAPKVQPYEQKRQPVSTGDGELIWRIRGLSKTVNWRKGAVLQKIAKQLKEFDIALHHDDEQHFALFKISSGQPVYAKERKKQGKISDADRKKLRSWLMPKAFLTNDDFDNTNGPIGFDRTHLFPVGYIGTERDNRLIVWFDRDYNQNEFNDFEQSAKEYLISNGGYWMTVLERNDNGTVDWVYKIFNTGMNKVIMQLKITSKESYVWGDMNK